HSSQNERLREELKMQEYQNSVNLEYYKNVEKNSVEARKIRHDLANMVQTACEIMENGTDGDKEAAKRMFAQLKTEVSDIKIERFCENPLVNAIASNKAAECRKNNIEFDFDLRVPETVGIEEVDICKAYVNIFDNAINAAKAIDGKRYVKIKSFTDESDGMLYITGENNVAPDYEDKKKSRTGEHGYGLRILRDTAEKYGGRLVTDDKGNTFTVVMTMKAESQPA
ncbi:MAG: ATP-binding protein, partial [Oscillospiraceae bacterium]|nr:ATP-binding protein [Oscillospiraceae bacterium]